MSAHTPGPWTASFMDTSDARSSIAYIRATNHVEIAVLFHDEDQAANAHLITAAPDLLAALKELVAAGAFAVESVDEVAIMLRLGTATDWAHAVIVKAEGRV